MTLTDTTGTRPQPASATHQVDPADTVQEPDGAHAALRTGIAAGILMERYGIGPERSLSELQALSRRHGVPLDRVLDVLTASRLTPATWPVRDEHQSLADAVLGYICLDRDAQGPVLAFTGEVTKDVVTRFRLLERPARWPARVDLRTTTFLSAAALGLLRHMATKQNRLGSKLTLTVTDPLVRHQLQATGITAQVTVRAD